MTQSPIDCAFFEAADGVGQRDVDKSFLKDDSSLKSPATQQQMKDGFAWACEFGRTSVVDCLLQRGLKLDEKLRHDGQTGLHWAAYGGHADTVKLLLQRGAPIDAKDESYGGTPLRWALYVWGNCTAEEAERGRYYEVVALLARAGATLDPQWYEDDEDRQRAATKLRSDPRMLAAPPWRTAPLSSLAAQARAFRRISLPGRDAAPSLSGS